MIARIFAYVLVAFALCGCSKISSWYEANPIMTGQSDLLKDNAGKPTEVINPDRLKSAITGATTNSTRNALMLEMITISNQVCSLHQASIISNSNSWNLLTGTGVNLFSGLGTAITDVGTKTALSAASAFSGASRSLGNEEVYANKLGTTIVRGIGVARDSAYAALQTAMQKDTTQYPIEQGILDIQEYHRRCSFYYGLLQVTTALDNRKKTKAEIENDLAFLDTQIKNDETKQNEDLKKKRNELVLERVNAPY